TRTRLIPVVIPQSPAVLSGGRIRLPDVSHSISFSTFPVNTHSSFRQIIFCICLATMPSCRLSSIRTTYRFPITGTSISTSIIPHLLFPSFKFLSAEKEQFQCPLSRPAERRHQHLPPPLITVICLILNHHRIILFRPCHTLQHPTYSLL